MSDRENASGNPDRQHGEGRISLETYRSGSFLVIYLNDRPAFTAIVSDPSLGQAVVRPAVPSQRAAGYHDARTTLGSRPYREGSDYLVSEEVDPGITWGDLKVGEELVMRNEEVVFGTQGRVLYTGRVLTGVVKPSAMG